MDDKQILDLYWARSESAISESMRKYGRYCHFIAYNILHNAEDSEECVSETWLKAWNSMPPHRPGRLSAFLGKITRHLSLNRYQHCNAEKRGSGQITLALDELQECVGRRFRGTDCGRDDPDGHSEPFSGFPGCGNKNYFHAAILVSVFCQGNRG